MHLRPTVLRDRLDSLSRLQDQLDDDIRTETSQPSPDRKRLQMLKRKRRLVGQRITEMSAPRVGPHNNPAPQAAPGRGDRTMIDFTGLLEKATGLLGEANVADLISETDPATLLQEAGIEGGAENSVVDRITELFEQSRS